MKKIIFPIFLCIVCFLDVNAQTYVKPGDISGNWYKGNSPYIITGDINVPSGKSLKIAPGVKVIFDGPYILNVQGNLYAEGTINDSIWFTVSDTSGFSEYMSGWNGIHFDPRPIVWDKVSEVVNTDASSMRTDKKRISINLKVEDLINDSNNYSEGIRSKSRISFCRFEYGSSCRRNRPYTFGGAIYIYQYPDLVIKNSLFYLCNAYSGGAIYCKEAAPFISGNLIRKCKSISSGGGMVFIYSGPIISDNTIINNCSGYNAGGLLFFECCPYVINNKILKNQAHNAGGGIHVEKLTTPVITNDNYEINSNTRKSIDFITAQNLIEISTKRFWEEYKGKFHNNIICNNSSIYGGGISIYSSAPELFNSTICDNSGAIGSGLYMFYSSPLVINSIIFNNGSDSESHQIFVAGKSTMEIRNTDLQSGIGSISLDSSCVFDITFSDIVNEPPLFKDQENLNYSLGAGSPCIDAGLSNPTIYLVSKSDINGDQRVINSIVDLGAIEFQTDAFDNSQKSTDEKPSISLNEVIFNLFPNPTKDNITLLISNNPYDEIRIRLYSYNGTVTYDKHYNINKNTETIIDLEDIPSGVYIFKAISDRNEVYSNTIKIE